MTWKIYALASGGAFLATYLVSFAPPLETQQSAAGPAAQTSAAPAEVDLGEQADRLHVRVPESTSFRAPVRDAFRFGGQPPRDEPPSLTSPVAPAAATDSPPVPQRPPFALAGMASTTEAGLTTRTAILSSLRGVLLVREGDIVEDLYRVVTVEDVAVTLEALSDGSRTRIALSGSEPR